MSFRYHHRVVGRSGVVPFDYAFVLSWGGGSVACVRYNAPRDVHTTHQVVDGGSGKRILEHGDHVDWQQVGSEPSVGVVSCFNHSRAVSTEEGAKFAEENGLIFLETSAKTAANVEEVVAVFTIHRRPS